MGIRLNRIPESHFAPVVYVDRTGRQYQRKPGAPRKIPREARRQLYELGLTLRETKAEIARLMALHDICEKNRHWSKVMARIMRERGS